MSFVTILLLSAFPLLVIVAALKDVTTMTIPNWLCGALALTFFPAALSSGLPLSTAGVHLAVGFVALLVGMGMFAARWLGGGDAKLFAAVALWLGWPDTGTFLVVTGLAGGALTLGLLSARKIAPMLPTLGPAWSARLLEPEGDIPYGVAIAAGALFAFSQSRLANAFSLMM